jgi:hypothetical protein
VIGVPDDVKGTAMVAFCVLADPSQLRLRFDDARETRAVAVCLVEVDLQTELKSLVSR